MARSLLLGFALAAALAAAACTGTDATSTGRSTPPPPPPSSGRPVDETQPDVVVDGTRFVTADGEEVRLHGVAVHSLDPVVYQRAPDLGVNFVRLAVAWSDFEPNAPQGDTHAWDGQRLADLDTEIRFYAEHGIQVLLDMHQYGWSPYFASLQRGGRANGIPRWIYHGRRFPLTTQGREAAQARMYTDRRATELYGQFAAMLAERYRTTPNVLGYEILNEPPLGNMPRRAWAVQRIIRWQARVATAVRAVDPNRAIVFMVPPRTDVRSVHLQPLERLGHLALDVHDYYAGTGKRYRTTLQGGRYRGTLAQQAAYLSPFVSIARSWNVPLIVGEWGAFPSERGVGAYQRQMVTLFAHEGVSWTRWSLDRTERLGLLRRDGRLTTAAVQLGRLIAAEAGPTA
ncbi:MAG TPA: cellulase family glycosylhydrolase [Gaiellales bacterium]